MVVPVPKLQQKHPNNWDEYLDAIVFAYNTSKHQTTRYSLSLVDLLDSLLTLLCNTLILGILMTISFIFRKFCKFTTNRRRANILGHQRYNKQRYDRNRRELHYNLDDRVFTKIFAAQGKLDPRYSVDPTVVLQVNHPAYVVRHESSGIERQYHVSDLRPVTIGYNDDSRL